MNKWKGTWRHFTCSIPSQSNNFMRPTTAMKLQKLLNEKISFSKDSESGIRRKSLHCLQSHTALPRRLHVFYSPDNMYNKNFETQSKANRQCQTYSVFHGVADMIVAFFKYGIPVKMASNSVCGCMKLC